MDILGRPFFYLLYMFTLERVPQEAAHLLAAHTQMSLLLADACGYRPSTYLKYGETVNIQYLSEESLQSIEKIT